MGTKEEEVIPSEDFIAEELEKMGFNQVHRCSDLNPYGRSVNLAFRYGPPAPVFQLSDYGDRNPGVIELAGPFHNERSWHSSWESVKEELTRCQKTIDKYQYNVKLLAKILSEQFLEKHPDFNQVYTLENGAIIDSPDRRILIKHQEEICGLGDEICAYTLVDRAGENKTFGRSIKIMEFDYPEERPVLDMKKFPLYHRKRFLPIDEILARADKVFDYLLHEALKENL